MYIITLTIFLATLILPFFFLFPFHRKIKGRLIIITIQIILFIAWNLIFYGVMNGTLPYSFGVWGTGDPESSVFMLHLFIKPIVTIVLTIELIAMSVIIFVKRSK